MYSRLGFNVFGRLADFGMRTAAFPLDEETALYS
jgi:hypothetical protein